jgi:transposase
MSKSKKLTNPTPEQKVQTLRRHLIDQEPISALSLESGLPPTAFSPWREQLFSKAAHSIFQPAKPALLPSREKELAAKIERLELRLKKKDEVIAELSEQCVDLKKELGEP